jgi:RNA methyltransferase, TrmH family
MSSATGKPSLISSLANPHIKNVVKLRQRSHRDEFGLMIVEGYRELKRALDNKHFPTELFFCKDLFQGENEGDLIQRCADAGTSLFECAPPVFEKIAYRDRPEGLLAVAPQVRKSLTELSIPKNALVIVAEAIEKPGNLGTILRSADASGVNAVLVCDKCTDINNPNVVRASIGTLFSVPVIETSTDEALAWLKTRKFQVVAATPHTEKLFWDVDMTGNTAIVVGTEQYGLSNVWLDQAQLKVKIPMLGQADSLNVASATTILLYEAVRQRQKGEG